MLGSAEIKAIPVVSAVTAQPNMWWQLWQAHNWAQERPKVGGEHGAEQL